MSRPADHRLRAFFDEARDEFAAAAGPDTVLRHDLRFGNTTVRLEFASPALAAALLPAFAPRVVAGDATGDPDVGIRLWESTTPLPWRDHDLAARGLLRGRDGDSVTVVHEAGSTAVTMTAAGTRDLLYRVDSAAALPWWERAAPLRPALAWALAGPGTGLVHAGAVGDTRGGLLLGGPGGSGKTTTALAALDAGWRYLADDYLLLDVDGPPTAHNLFGTAKLDDGHLARFPVLAALAGPAADGPDEKTVLDVARGRPEAVADRLALRAVAVPRITGGASRHWRISGAEALLALAPSTVFQMPYDDGGVVRLLSRLVREVPCHGVGVGDDVGELAACLDDLLEAASA